MAYTKTTWVEGGAPGVSAANLNKIEQGIADSFAQMDSAGLGVGAPVAADLNAISISSDSGFYTTINTTLNKPDAVDGAVIHIARDSRPSQIFFDHINNKIYYRGYTAAGWQAWHSVLTDAGGFTMLADINMGGKVVNNAQDMRLVNGSRFGEDLNQRARINAHFDRLDVVTQAGSNYILKADYTNDVFQFKTKNIFYDGGPGGAFAAGITAPDLNTTGDLSVAGNFFLRGDNQASVKLVGNDLQFWNGGAFVAATPTVFFTPFATTVTASSSTPVLIPESSFSPTEFRNIGKKVYFEAVVKAPVGGSVGAALYNGTGSAALISGTQVTTGNQSYIQIRSGDISAALNGFAAGQIQVGVYLASGSGSASIVSARIIVKN